MIRIWMALILAPVLLVLGCADLPAAEFDAAAGDLRKCVMQPQQFCTRDRNICGNASRCGCAEKYTYNARLGKCVIDLDDPDLQPGTISREPADASSSCAKRPEGACTRDINPCGHPSKCTCEEGYRWNAAAGLCIKIDRR